MELEQWSEYHLLLLTSSAILVRQGILSASITNERMRKHLNSDYLNHIGVSKVMVHIFSFFDVLIILLEAIRVRMSITIRANRRTKRNDRF